MNRGEPGTFGNFGTENGTSTSAIYLIVARTGPDAGPNLLKPSILALL
jgi:hypothetical protein